MPELITYLVTTGFLLLCGYIVSVFADAIYIDPDEIREIFPQLSRKRRKQLEKLTANPRAFYQVALLVRITSAIALGVLSGLVIANTAALGFLSALSLYILIFFIFWIITVVVFIYLPRRISPSQAKLRLIKFLPFVHRIYQIGSPIMKLLGRIPASANLVEVTEDQKDDIVERAIETLAESTGISEPIIEEDEKQMIHQIFQLDVTDVEEIMIPRIDIFGFEIHTKLDEIVETVKKHGFSRYPIYKETIDNIVGMVKVKDLLHLIENRPQKFELSDFIREPLQVGEHKKIDQLLGEFKKTKTHMAIVIDEFGGTAGLVTLEDILEEIVGEIQDEDDTPDSLDIIQLDNGYLRISGACPLEDLAYKLGIELEQAEFETVGGMIYDIVGSVPNEGTSFTWKNHRMKILEIEGQRIKKILVIPGQ